MMNNHSKQHSNTVPNQIAIDVTDHISFLIKARCTWNAYEDWYGPKTAREELKCKGVTKAELSGVLARLERFIKKCEELQISPWKYIPKEGQILEDIEAIIKKL